MKYNDNGIIKDVVVKAGDSLPIGTIVEYDGDTIPAGYEAVRGYIEILNLQTKILAASNVPSDGAVEVSDTFAPVDDADGYIAMQQNNNWLIPTGISVTGTTLNATLLNPFSSTKTGNCSFIIMAYKRR